MVLGKSMLYTARVLLTLVVCSPALSLSQGMQDEIQARNYLIKFHTSLCVQKLRTESIPSSMLVKELAKVGTASLVTLLLS